MNKTRIAAIAGLLLAHVLLLSWVLWRYEPRPERDTRVVEGYVTRADSCIGRGCDQGLRVDQVLLACGVSPIGASFSCPDWFRTDLPVRATYFRMPTLLSSAGIGTPSNVVLRLEQGRTVLWQRTPDEHRSNYYFLRSWVLIAIFASSFCILVRQPLFRRRSRRAGKVRR